AAAPPPTAPSLSAVSASAANLAVGATAAPNPSGMGVAPAMAVNPTPPAGMPRGMQPGNARPPSMAEEAFASTMAPPAAMAPALAAVTRPQPIADKKKDTIVEPPPAAGTL